MEQLACIKKVLNNSITALNNKYIKRQSKLTFTDIIYGLTIKTIHDTSYDKVVYAINSKNKTNISVSGFKAKCNFITYDDVIKLNKNILNVIYKKNEPRIIAVDGTNLKCLKSLHDDGVKYASTNETYTHMLISGIYDINSKIVINYNHSLTLNERDAFIEQLSYINKGDTLIFDRGYYSYELMTILKEKQINYIFRVKKTLKFVKKMIALHQEELYITHDNKVVTYTIYDEGEPYYLYYKLLLC